MIFYCKRICLQWHISQWVQWFVNGRLHSDWVSEIKIEIRLRWYRTVMSVRVPRNTQTGKNKGFALARMGTEEACEKIIEEFNGENCKDINGITVRCKAKLSKMSRTKKGLGNKTSNRGAALVLVKNSQVPQQLCYPGPMTNHGCSAIMQVFPAPPQMRFATPPTMWCPPPMQPTF